jgi:hypothetical protein
MTSVLNVDEIAAKNGTSPVALTKQSAAKAWCDLIFSHDSYNDSFGFSSLTDNGTGDGTGTFTSAFANNDYATACSMKSGGSTNRGAVVNTVTTTTVQMITGLTASDSKQDYNSAYILCGDLA